MKKILLKLVTMTCCIFTALMLFFCVSMLLSEMSTRAFLASDIPAIIGISALFAFISLVFYVKPFNFYVKLAVHFIFTALALYLVLLIVGSTSELASYLAPMRIFAVIFYTVLYAICATVIICVRAVKSSKV